MTISKKLTFEFLAIAVISIFLVGLLIYTSTKDVLKTEILNKIHLIVEEKEEALTTLLETQLANLQYLAQEPEVVKLTIKMVNSTGNSSSQDQQKAFKQLKTLLTNFGDFYGGPGIAGGTYADIMVADMNGYMWIGTYGPDEGGNEADTNWFRNGKKDIYLGDIEYNPTMRQITQIAAMPIRDKQGKTVAVLQLETNIKAINIIMAHKSGLGNTGEIYIVNKDKFIITKSKFTTPDIKNRTDTFGINQAVETNEDVSLHSVYDNYRGISVIGSVHIFAHSLETKNKKIGDSFKNLGWLLVGEIEKEEAFAPIAQLRNKIIFIGLIILLVVACISFFISMSISKPLKKLSVATQYAGKGQWKKVEGITSKDELGELASSFNKMTEELQKKNEENETNSWLTTGQSELNDKMRGELDVVVLSQNIISHLCDFLNAKIGTLYMADSHATLNLVGSYADEKRKNLSNKFSPGEGLVGQAALGKQLILVTDVPKNYIKIQSGLGHADPFSIVVKPILFEGNAIGVIELGAFHEFSDLNLEFLDLVFENIAIAINSSQSRSRMAELLEETQQQAEELQTQQEELRQANEELEEQTKSLKASEAMLQEQQEELRQTNEELEEQAQNLEEQKQEVDKKNRELELARQAIEEK